MHGLARECSGEMRPDHRHLRISVSFVYMTELSILTGIHLSAQSSVIELDYGVVYLIMSSTISGLTRFS